MHWGVQDSCLVLWLRALESSDKPVNMGMKFALAIGTARRLEHDEADQVFTYTYPEGSSETAASNPPAAPADQRGDEVHVYVREKVRVESADPSLLSLSAKLTALTNTLSLARANLAAVMGEPIEE